ncbi:MAG TPA: hypothetical protein VH255_02845 [Verrucomicrobiae bacterium]|jgi:hypothetical protein|nr:hypothetical protein [Verrucomicrobiae bacterium]
MARNKGKGGSKTADRAGVQFSLLGLIVFSVLLMGIGALVSYGFAASHLKATRMVSSSDVGPAPTNLPPWGELLVRDAELEQPEEYVAFELQTNRVEQWTFAGMNPTQVRDLMSTCGLPSDEINHAAQLMKTTVSGVTIEPDDQLILSLAPSVRAKLYGKLSGDDANHYMKYPFCYPGKSLENSLDENSMSKETIALIRKLCYPRGEAQCFSDYEFLLQHVPTDAARLSLVKALSRQTVAFVRLHIRPGTDIDRLLGYWGSAAGVRMKDTRPLLESVSRLEGGGNVSLLYLLPQFARQRLYTFPLPSTKADDPAMDCHWSTMNFFNETPDDRFSDSTYTTRYVLDHFYPVAKATYYGDIIFILDEKGNAIHSAVYICDDIIFTKNGNNFAQPWALMHMKDLQARYANEESPTRMVAYRNKDR